MTNHRDICKAWANGTAKILKGYAIFTNGEGRIYSWGHHYILGQTYFGAHVALINSTGYSASTGKHTSYATSAAVRAGLRIFMVPHPEKGNHPLNYMKLEADIAEAHQKAKRARTMKDYWERRIMQTTEAYADFKQLFPLDKE